VKKSFKYWTRYDLHIEIGLANRVGMADLKDWISHTETLCATEIQVLDRLVERSSNFIDGWNEAELMQKFINKVIDLADFDMPEYFCTYFVERYISATVNQHTLYGFADWMVAKGITQPTQPYFFMHEYKPEGEKQIDGRGQLLALMLATQALNNKEDTIYGCYVHGRMWFFVVLKGLEYEISQSFDAIRKEELYQILCILKRQKQMILKKIKF
jgi:hypothetical protein